MKLEHKLFIRKTLKGRRVFNSILVYSSYFLSLLFRKPIFWGFPPTVMIEPTNICNLKCPLCPSGNGTLKRPKGYMDYGLFKKIIDEIKSRSFMVVLWNQGESFLNRDFLKMVKYASDAGLFTLVSTNGNLDIDPEVLVDSGLDSMIISLDGADQETYNKYRINGNIEKVLKNVEKIVEVKTELNTKTPVIRWQFLIMKHNEDQIETVRQMAGSLGVDEFELKTLQIYTKEDIEEFLPKNHEFSRYRLTGDDFELKVGIPNRCRRIWTSPVINWNGEMAICCFDKDVSYKIGNINEQSIINIWKGKAVQKIRSRILKDRKSLEICCNCGESVKLRVLNLSSSSNNN
jgi:radical SAM protein with 4Fe4S-binding SPASM domain